MAALADEVDSLLASIPDAARGPGQGGTAWLGLVRFRAMVELCAGDSDSSLSVQGD